MRFGEVLARARKLRGLTQKELGSRSAIKQQRISQLEGSRRRPTLEELELLCRALPEASGDLKSAARLSRGRSRPRSAGDLDICGRIPYPAPYVRPHKTETEAWMGHARKTEPELYSALYQEIARRADRALVWDHLGNTACDSKVELFTWLHGLKDGALLFRQSVARLGLTHLPAVHFETGEVVSGRPMYGYLWARGELATSLVPQVTLLAGRAYTVDALGIAFAGTRRAPFILEVDGDGHDSRWNQEREKALKLPTVRVVQDQVLKADFLDEYWRLVQEMLDLEKRSKGS